MAQFQFRLATVLKLRERDTEHARKEFGFSVQKRLRKEQEIEQTKDYLINQKMQSVGASTNVRELESRWYHLRTVQQELSNQEQEKRVLKEEEEQKRSLLLQAMQKEKAINLVKEKKYREFLYEENRKEQVFLDDIAQSRATRMM